MFLSRIIQIMIPSITKIILYNYFRVHYFYGLITIFYNYEKIHPINTDTSRETILFLE